MSLGRNLTIILYDKKLTARQLAASVGVCESLISKIKKGERTASPELLERIAKTLEVDTAALTG